MFRIVLVIVMTFLIRVNSQTIEATTSYQYSRVLVEADVAKMYWSDQTSTNENRIDIELHVKDSDWMIFCLNYRSSRLSDCVVSGLNKQTGIGHFSDRFILDESSLLESTRLTGMLVKDVERDSLPLHVFYNGSVLVYKFSRPIKRCDESGQDLDIQAGMTSILFAYGTNGSRIANNNNITIVESRVYFNDIDGNEIAGQLARIEVELISSSKVQMLSNLACPINNESVPEFESQSMGIYKNSIELVSDMFKFFWNITNSELIGEIHCRTTGWVGFGLTSTGKMEESDIVIGYIINGKANFTDRHITNDRQVVIDAQQDWHLISSRESNGFTVFKFKRLLKTCDKNDLDIEEGTPKLIYAWGTSDSFQYHGYTQRGVRNVFLIDHKTDKSDAEMPLDIEKIVFRIENVIIPIQSTYYYNEIVKAPYLSEKRHVVKWELEFSKLNFENMHHMVYYECKNYNGTPVIPAGDSTQSNIYDRYCSVASFGWAIGANLYNLYPNNTGVPIGGPDSDYSYLRLDIHYDNPMLKFAYIDKIDVIYYVTKQLREHEVGLISIGSFFGPLAITIPPGETAYTVTSNCYNSCIRSKLDGKNITVIMAFPHTHLAGLEVSTSLIRNGTDVGYVFKNKNYQFDFQQTYILSKPVIITPNDELITKCVYQTKDSSGFTYGGMGTRQEMCLQFITYYPRIPKFNGCFSMPSGQEAYAMMLKLNETGDVNLGDSTNPQQTLMNGFYSLNPASDNAKNAIRQFNLNHSNNMICDIEFDPTNRMPIKTSNIYVEPDKCSSIKQPSYIIQAIITYIRNVLNSLWNFFHSFW